MASALTKSSKYLLLTMGAALVFAEVIDQVTALRALSFAVGCVFLVAWVISLPVGAIACVLERRRRTEEYTWPVLLLIGWLLLLVLAFLLSRTMIL
jgi:hypothetical protein